MCNSAEINRTCFILCFDRANSWKHTFLGNYYKLWATVPCLVWLTRPCSSLPWKRRESFAPYSGQWSVLWFFLLVTYRSDLFWHKCDTLLIWERKPHYVSNKDEKRNIFKNITGKFYDDSPCLLIRLYSPLCYLIIYIPITVLRTNQNRYICFAVQNCSKESIALPFGVRGKFS